jgi:hypothetical protein
MIWLGSSHSMWSPDCYGRRRRKAKFLLWSLQREGAAQVFERTDREPIAP